MKNNKLKCMIIVLIFAIIDQVLKHIIEKNIQILPIEIMKNLLTIQYVQNFGIAFGLGIERKILLITVNLIIIIGIAVYLFHKIDVISSKNNFFLSIIIAGGIGNLIDRICRGYVVDYIDIIPKLNFPVFNFADIIIVIGIIYLIVEIICNEIKINENF